MQTDTKLAQAQDSEATREPYADRKPVHEFKPSLSKDGKFWILKYTTTWIVPVNYLGTILQNHEAQAAPVTSHEDAPKPEIRRKGGRGQNDRAT